MQKFIKEIVVFFIFFLLFSIVSFSILRAINLQYDRNIIHESALSIIGNSHPETAINDKILTKITNINCYNYSRSAQSMFWTIIGGRKLINQGSKYILIELTNSSYTTDWKTTDKVRTIDYHKRKYYLRYNDWFYLLKRNPGYTVSFFLKFSLPTRKITGSFLKHNFEFKPKIVVENSRKIDKKIFNPDFDDKVIHDFIYRNNSIQFIICRVPQHPDYYKRIGRENERFFIERLESFKKYHNCIVMDFGHKYKDNSLFADLGHMNFRGANVFTQFLAEALLDIPEFKEASFFKCNKKSERSKQEQLTKIDLEI